MNYIGLKPFQNQADHFVHSLKKRYRYVLEVSAEKRLRKGDTIHLTWGDRTYGCPGVQAPCLAFLFLLFSLASLGLPGLANFAGEILVLLGTFQQHPFWAVVALLGVVFAAAYMLRLVQGVIWGPAKTERTMPDLTMREWLILLPMAILVVWIGVYPEPFLAPLHGTVATLLAGGLP